MPGLHYSIGDSSAESMHKATVLVSGKTEVVVVDAGSTRADGHRIVAELLDTGKTVTAVVITAADPDYYFGAEVIAAAFPEVRFLAPVDVIARIFDTFTSKLEAWAGFGVNLPTRLVNLSELEEGAHVNINGVSLELRRGSEHLGDRAWYLYEPRERVMLGGALLFQGLHLWTADTPTPELRAEWRRVLQDLLSMEPSRVVAAHRAPGSLTDTSAITYTRDYLDQFEQIISASRTAAEAKAALFQTYPDAGLVIAADLGTRVAKGEMTWD